MGLAQITRSADSNDGSATTVATAAFPGSSVAGNCITGHIAWQGATATATVTDGVTTGTVYDTATIDTPNGLRMATYVIQNITSGGPRAVTATFTDNCQYRRISAQEWNNVATTSQPNKHIASTSAAFGTGTDAVTSTTQTTTVDGCTIVGFAADVSAATIPATGTGFANADSATRSAGDAFRVESKVQSTQGSVAATFTTSAGTDIICAAMLALVNTAPGAPVYSSAVVANATPSTCTLTYDVTLGTSTSTTAGDYTFSSSGGQTVSSVSRSGATVILTLSAPMVFGQTATIAVAAGKVYESTNATAAGALSAQTVMNNVLAAGATLAQLERGVGRGSFRGHAK